MISSCIFNLASGTYIIMYNLSLSDIHSYTSEAKQFYYKLHMWQTNIKLKLKCACDLNQGLLIPKHKDIT